MMNKIIELFGTDKARDYGAIKGKHPTLRETIWKTIWGQHLNIGGYNNEKANLFGMRKHKLRIPAKALLAS